ncbi:MAG: lysophospholipid acyltransferase family protein [Planctomycetota bacterium]
MSDPQFTHRLIGRLTALALPRFLDCFDFRICHYDRSGDPRLEEYNEHGIFTFWHEYIGNMLPRWGRTSVTALCSMHRDGEWVNQTALSSGMHVVRGSSSRGGATAVRQLRENIHFSSIVITPDGPRGPRRVMAPGPIYLASKLQVPLLPVGVAISNPHRLNTWDQFAIPKPGSRIRVILGPKVRLPKKLKRDELERKRSRYQLLMNDLSKEAELWASSGRTMAGEMMCHSVRRSPKLYFDSQKTPSLGQGCMANDGVELPSVNSIRAA